MIKILFIKNKELKQHGPATYQSNILHLFNNSKNFKLIIITDDIDEQLKFKGGIKLLLRYIKLTIKIRKHIKYVDYLYIPSLIRYGLFATLISSLFKIPFIIPILGWYEKELIQKGVSKIKRFILLKYEIWVYRNAKYLLTSHDLTNVYAKTVKHENKFINIDLPIDTNRFKPTTSKSEILKNKLKVNNKKCILTVTSLAPGMPKEVGLKILIDAFIIIKKEYNNVVLLIAGNGRQKKKFENLIKKLNVKDDIRLIGYCDFLYKLGIKREKLSRLVHILHIEKILRKIVPRKIISITPRKDGKIRGQDKSYIVNWNKTKVLPSSHGPIYVNLDKNTREYENFVNELIKKLDNVKNPLTSKKVVNKVYKKEEIYSGEYLKEAPDLIIDPAKGVRISDHTGKKDIFEIPKKLNSPKSPRSWRAENKKTGLFMAYGPDIKNNKKIDDVSILDLAPTILHMFNISIPNDMDGKVLKEILKEDSELAKRPIKYQEIDEKDRIKKKIIEMKVLGKL